MPLISINTIHKTLLKLYGVNYPVNLVVKKEFGRDSFNIYPEIYLECKYSESIPSLKKAFLNHYDNVTKVY